MKEKIPEEIKKMYQKTGFKVGLYARLRWRLCPFKKIESLLPARGVIIDFGCGYGLLANYLAIKSDQRRVIGVDNSFNRLNVARATVGSRSNIQFIKSNIDEFDLPRIDGAVMSDFLHHLPDYLSEKIITDIFKNLNPGGRLVIEEVGRRPFLKYLSNLFIDHLLYPGQKINFKPIKSWQGLLEYIGFKAEVVPAHKDLPLSDYIIIATKI